jgi:predicted ABC-type ATPase
MRPNLYIVAGPNGAGKTTFAREFLPNYADHPVMIACEEDRDLEIIDSVLFLKLSKDMVKP